MKSELRSSYSSSLDFSTPQVIIPLEFFVLDFNATNIREKRYSIECQSLCQAWISEKFTELNPFISFLRRVNTSKEFLDQPLACNHLYVNETKGYVNDVHHFILSGYGNIHTRILALIFFRLPAKHLVSLKSRG